jgi:hypothetical protein
MTHADRARFHSDPANWKLGIFDHLSHRFLRNSEVTQESESRDR